jgi:predicted dehydrogenase
MKKIAIVGAGSWSRDMHLPALRRLQDAGRADYVAVCDLDPAKAGAYAASLGARAFTDLDAMLAGVKPDGVALLVSEHVTPVLIETCIRRGLPFITEKPPAPDVATHRRLLEAVGELPHIVAFNRRHAPYVRQAVEWMRDAPLQGVFCDFSRHNRRSGDFGATFVHGIDTVQYLARSEFAEARLEVAPVDGGANLYIGGWTASGVRLELRIMPVTGSAREHYTVISVNRSVVVAYPQPPMIDLPGFVELHDCNRLVVRKSAVDFGLAPDDLSGLGGIVREHELLVEILEGSATAWSTLRTSLPTQMIRDSLGGMVSKGARVSQEIILK